MRGRPGCPTGQEKKPVRATVSNPPFLQGKVGYQIAPSSDPASPAHLWFMVASPGPDRTVPRTVRPPRGRLWGGGSFPAGYPIPFRPTDSPGRAHPASPGGSPQTGPKCPTHLSTPPTRPAGHASQSSAGRSRRKRIKSCFDRLRRPKHTSQPPVCPQGARSGCNPQFWEGPPTKQAT